MLLIYLMVIPLFAGSSLKYLELNLIGGFSSDAEFLTDVNMQKNSAGFEYFRKFSSEFGDFLTFDTQFRLSANVLKNHKFRIEPEFHNLWLEYKLGLGYNIRIGHYDIPFGLEPYTDTHSTIMQTLLFNNLGFKQDWGINLNGALKYIDYSISVSLGSGMKLKPKSGQYILSFRVGSPSTENFFVGLSFLAGRFRSSTMHNLTEETKAEKQIALDCQYLLGPVLFKFETSYGQNNFGALSWIDLTPPIFQRLTIQFQPIIIYENIKGQEIKEISAIFGSSLKITSYATFRTAYFLSFETGNKRGKPNAIYVQLYIYKGV